GTNKKLYSSLKRKIKKYKKKIQVFRYVDNIHELMGISDVIITKPGGVTVAEVLAKRMPMIIVKPLPGQEASNANYLTEKGAAIRLDQPQDINLVIEDLFANPAHFNQICESCGRISKPNASLDVARLLLD
ncbi:MAG: glycosyltransferase, partial [Candidatus Omnitrophica bacterium]|nr:glycosyltransferase [Candidatus Omnitrophota bacterium]